MKKLENKLHPIDFKEEPTVGELVFSWSLYQERWRSYQVITNDVSVCKVTKGPKWYVFDLETGHKTWILVKYLHRGT